MARKIKAKAIEKWRRQGVVSVPRYHFTEVPNNPYGRLFIKCLKKFLNKDGYYITVKGQHLKKDANWRLFEFGQPIYASTHLRVYLDRRKDNVSSE